jgi:hypothetical protein
MKIIVTGASIAATCAHQTQPRGKLNGKPQADWANSCPRSPATNVGSTTKYVKTNSQKTIENEAIVTSTPHVMPATIAGQAAN